MAPQLGPSLNEKRIYSQTALGLAIRERPVRTMRQEPGGNYNPAGKFSRLHRLRSQARHSFAAAAAGHDHDRHKNFRQARHQNVALLSLTLVQGWPTPRCVG